MITNAGMTKGAGEGRAWVWVRLVPLLMLVALATACARGGLVKQVSSDSTATLTVVGDVRTVAFGQTHSREMLGVPTELLAVGIGVGAVSPQVGEQGTAMIVGGTGMVETLGGRGLLRERGTLYSSSMVGLTPNHRAAAIYTVSGKAEGESLDRVLEELSRRHGPLFFVVGVGEFPLLSGRALQEAPTAEIPIHGANAERFYRTQDQSGVRAVFAAAVHSMPDTMRGAELQVFHEPAERRRGDRRVVRGGYAVVTTLDELDPARLASEGLAQVSGRTVSVGELQTNSRVRNARIAVYQIESLDRR